MSLLTYADIAIEAAEWLKRDVWRLAESLTLSGDPARARREIAEFVAGETGRKLAGQLTVVAECAVHLLAETPDAQRQDARV